MLKNPLSSLLEKADAVGRCDLGWQAQSREKSLGEHFLEFCREWTGSRLGNDMIIEAAIAVYIY